MAVSLSARAISDRRISNRTRVGRKAVLRFSDSFQHIELDDLTGDGCKIETDADLEVGSNLTLGLAGIGRTSARVVWRSGDTYGCLFEAPLSPSSVAAANRENVGYLFGVSPAGEEASTHEFKWSARHRLLFIIGSSTLLWATVLATLSLIF